MYYQLQPNGKYRFFESYEDYMTGKTKYVSCTLDSCSKKAHKEAYMILQDKIDKVSCKTCGSVPNRTKRNCKRINLCS